MNRSRPGMPPPRALVGQGAGPWCAVLGCGLLGRGLGAAGRRLDDRRPPSAAPLQRDDRHRQRPSRPGRGRPVGDDAGVRSGRGVRDRHRPGAAPGRRRWAADPGHRARGGPAGRGEPGTRRGWRLAAARADRGGLAGRGPAARALGAVGAAAPRLGRCFGTLARRARSLAGTYNLGGWFTAAGGRRPSEGPVPDVRPDGAGQRPRRSGSLAAIRAAAAAWLGVTYRCKVMSRGRAAPPRHRVPVPARGPGHHHPGRRLVFHVCAALAESIRGLIVEGFALSGAATGQHGQAAALPAWLAAHQAPRPAQIPGGQRRVRRAAEDRDLTQLRIPGFPAGTAAGPGTA